MTSRKRAYTVACLSGDGVGPEVMAEASRAVAAVSRHHGFSVQEVHAPFGGEALSRSGHLLPAGTRGAYREADAVLVAAAGEPALAGVVADLDLRASVTQVRFPGRGDVCVLSPLDDEASEWTVERAFVTALSRRARLTSVGPAPEWRATVDRVAAGHDGVPVEHLSVTEAAPRLAFDPQTFDVVVASTHVGEALAGLVGSAGEGRVVASGRVGPATPGVFVPVGATAAEIAGQGIANPCSMVLAAALMLAEGLGERSAAETLAGAVTGAVAYGVRTPDMAGAGLAQTTREFMDVLLAELPRAVTNFEFSREAYAA